MSDFGTASDTSTSTSTFGGTPEINWGNTAILDPATQNLLNTLPTDLAQQITTDITGAVQSPLPSPPVSMGGVASVGSSFQSNFLPLAFLGLIAVGAILLLQSNPSPKPARR